MQFRSSFICIKSAARKIFYLSEQTRVLQQFEIEEKTLTSIIFSLSLTYLLLNPIVHGGGGGGGNLPPCLKSQPQQLLTSNLAPNL